MKVLSGWVIGAKRDGFICEENGTDVGLNDRVEENRNSVDRVEVGDSGVRVDMDNECDVCDVVVRALEKRSNVRNPLNMIVRSERVIDEDVGVRDRMSIDGNKWITGVTHLQ